MAQMRFSNATWWFEIEDWRAVSPDANIVHVTMLCLHQIGGRPAFMIKLPAHLQLRCAESNGCIRGASIYPTHTTTEFARHLYALPTDSPKFRGAWCACARASTAAALLAHSAHQ